jgi:hypothetical protein
MCLNNIGDVKSKSLGYIKIFEDDEWDATKAAIDGTGLFNLFILTLNVMSAYGEGVTAKAYHLSHFATVHLKVSRQIVLQ